MFSHLLRTLRAGLSVMRTNTRLIMVAVLVFLFPLLFMWVVQSFIDTTITNVNTADRKRVAADHQALTTLLKAGFTASSSVFSKAAVEKLHSDYDIAAIRVLSSTEAIEGLASGEQSLEKFSTLYELTNDAVRSELFLHPFYRGGFTADRTFLLGEIQLYDYRVWQSLTEVPIEGEEALYLFIEYNFATADTLIAKREQNAYYALSVIYLFLILLAYWLYRQTDWEKRFLDISAEMEERDLFSNMIAHEFRAPLTAIKGYASFLQESKTISKEELGYTNTIRVSAERLVALVNDFLEVARIQSGKMKLNPVLLDVRTVAIAVGNNLQVAAKEKNLTLLVKPGTTVIPIFVDEHRLTQVLVNVVNNAIKYTDHGSVTISCEQKNARGVITVMDTGAGIAAADQKKLFTPFERVGGLESTKKSGTGLGMFITKNLLKLLGGEIGVESIRGVGTHVVISFPISKMR